MSGRYRGVSRKDCGSGDDFKGGFEIDPEFDHDLGYPWQAGKSRMSFIHMNDFDFISHSRKRLHSTDSQKHFLSQTDFCITRVQPGCDFA